MTEFEKAMAELGKKAEPKQADIQEKKDQPKPQPKAEIKSGLCTIGEVLQWK